MSNTYKSSMVICLLAWTLPMLSVGFSPVQAGEWKFEAQLIWATTNKVSPNPNHKKVDAEIQKKLSKLPLKWNNYFEVSRQEITVEKGGTNKVCLSPKCNLKIQVIQGKKVEVSLLNKEGEVIRRQTQPLPKGEVLVLGGEAPNSTGWFVTLKRIED